MNTTAHVPLEAVFDAWRRAKRQKKPSMNQLAFEADWLARVLSVQQTLADLRWQPQRTVCFVATQPKTREIHAPDFTDRVVHHYLVPQLEALYEPVFIHDSYANRKNKGTHKAVQRVQQFMRQQPQGYYLQLDIHNFFNSLNRAVLYGLLCKRLDKALRHHKISAAKYHELKTLCHTLVNQQPARNAHYRGSAAEHANVPPHKRLINARPQCGLAVGNLSSQFFANVYLNALDQFVKHTLKCRHYLRYVDDFVLLHENPQQLLQWRQAIVDFLAQSLYLQLKATAAGSALAERDDSDVSGGRCPPYAKEEHKLPDSGRALPGASLPQPQPVRNGCDFLGYIIYPTHKVVRRRVIRQCSAKLREWQQHHWPTLKTASVGGALPTSGAINDPPCGRLNSQARQQIRALVGSYWGHFGHASHWRLTQALLQAFPWLHWLFLFQPGKPPVARFAGKAMNYFADQLAFYRYMYPHCHLRLQKGWQYVPVAAAIQPAVATVTIEECGWLRHGLKRREVCRIDIHCNPCFTH